MSDELEIIWKVAVVMGQLLSRKLPGWTEERHGNL
jgi:hypothetical protein